MGRLTPQERRRVFQAQEQARRTMLSHLTGAPVTAAERPARRGLRRLLVSAMLGALLGGGWLVYRTVEFHAMEFHPPGSIIEALLPRR